MGVSIMKTYDELMKNPSEQKWWYPDMLLTKVYYTADELRECDQLWWLETEPSWVVTVMPDGRLACVCNSDIEHARGDEDEGDN
jgi:hypothetical protein